jgi:hypothetical protein
MLYKFICSINYKLHHKQNIQSPPLQGKKTDLDALCEVFATNLSEFFKDFFVKFYAD